MSSAKQKPSNIKHGGGIRPNVLALTFAGTRLTPKWFQETRIFVLKFC